MRYRIKTLPNLSPTTARVDQVMAIDGLGADIGVKAGVGALVQKVGQKV